LVRLAGLEPATPCMQSETTSSILLVRLALFCFLLRDFHLIWQAFFLYGPMLDPNFVTPCLTRFRALRGCL